jgi:hypothetical protein
MLKPGQSQLRQNDKTRLGVLRVREIAYQKIVLTGNTHTHTHIYISVTQDESTIGGLTWSLRADVESKDRRGV